MKLYQVLYSAGSCLHHCGGAGSGCFCDSSCSKVGDCCSDYQLVCAQQSLKTSCQWRCGSSSNLRRISVRKGGDCNCDKYCSKVGDCCPDYQEKCHLQKPTTTTIATTTTTNQPITTCKGRCIPSTSISRKIGERKGLLLTSLNPRDNSLILFSNLFNVKFWFKSFRSL